MVEKKWLPVVNFEGRLEDVTLAEWIGQAVGAASMCWEDVEKAGVFDSTQARVISGSLHRHVQKVIDQVITGTRRAMAEESNEKARRLYQETKARLFAEMYGADSDKGRFAMAEVPLMQRVRQETKPTSALVDHVPHRGSNVEAWLKRYRDQFSRSNGSVWNIIDDLLDNYREHGDTGTPLSEDVIEAEDNAKSN